MLKIVALLTVLCASLSLPAQAQLLPYPQAVPARTSSLIPAAPGLVSRADTRVASPHPMRKADWIIFSALAALIAITLSLLTQQVLNARIPRNSVRRGAILPVVWVNLRSGIYFTEGSRWYRGTKDGRLMSLTVAQSRGFRKERSPAIAN